jgi:predicted enzyme related to lactoylglutathione lyase
MMFNLETKDVEAEFDRIKKLGATVVAKPYHPKEDPKGTIATFADPDANLFQLVPARQKQVDIEDPARKHLQDLLYDIEKYR